MYSPAAMEKAPAARPARPVMTMVCCPTEPPATPVISARLETRPSIAPNTAGRSQPPLTSRCVWLSRCASCSVASVSMSAMPSPREFAKAPAKPMSPTAGASIVLDKFYF
ncbi:hypothetical protein SHIRM173S_11296 [Streptomyces hirsutus]